MTSPASLPPTASSATRANSEKGIASASGSGTEPYQLGELALADQSRSQHGARPDRAAAEQVVRHPRAVAGKVRHAARDADQLSEAA